MGADISKSEQKRRMKRLEELVEALCGLPPGLLKQLPCSDRIRELLRETSTLKHGTRKRQIKYITKLLNNEPVEELYAFITVRRGAALEEDKRFKELEFLRDSLLNEAFDLHQSLEQEGEELEEEWQSRAAEEIERTFPGIDRKMLTRLARLFAATRQRRYSREIFRLLRAEQEKQKFSSGKTSPTE